MSWVTKKQGSATVVVAHVADQITKSAAYDPTLEGKAYGVAEATGLLISSAASDMPEGKELLVSSNGHFGHDGMSNYGLTVSFVDPTPEIKPVTDEQIAAAKGETGFDTTRGH